MPGAYLFKGGYVATLDESFGDFAAGAVLVEDGVIKAVGSIDDISAPDAEVIDTTDGVVIPGMVDTHRHVSMSLTRGIGVDQSLFHFLSNTYMRGLPATGVDNMYLSALVGSLEALDSGVTTIVDTCETFHSREHAEAELRGLEDSGIRAQYMYGMSGYPYGDVPFGRPAWEARLAHVKELKTQHIWRQSLNGNGIRYADWHGFPLIRECIERGIEPSLGIDTVSAIAPDLLSQMRLALQTQRCLDHDAAQKQRKIAKDMHFSARDALEWGTRNGAKAAGLGDRIGTLTPEKRADVVFICNKHSLSASADPLGTALWWMAIPGNVMGQLVGVDVQDLRARAKEGLKEIMENLSRVRTELNTEEIDEYLLEVERSTRINLAKAYVDQVSAKDAFRS
ncbi:hypothetical protein T440DRAFT_512398 [Plenodomus tracheiphilus IPT5]|uniref:Amidohydrolase-related domain-containing protein n=1 Tax=Plenodomus tracheiphilus IPT5 TaxID=1408161 RepID=A0A6A7APG5_9PLEO|nr:hypothetical protein T440DRAFT_512398 [Plenodomus tracheiphilus IPT5]